MQNIRVRKNGSAAHATKQGKRRNDEREREVARRVRHVRYYNQLSQAAFAHAIGISLDRLASIEYARTPLTVGVADNLTSKFDVSLIWLAEGNGRMKPCGGLILQVCPEIKPSSLLSEVYSPTLLQRFRESSLYGFFSMAAILTGDAGLPKGKGTECVSDHFHHQLDEMLQTLPHPGKEKLLNLLVRTLARFSLDWELGERKRPGELRRDVARVKGGAR